MKIKQHLLDNGFIVRVRTNKEMEDVIKYFGENVGDYDFDTYRDETCLDNYGENLEYADVDWYKNNHPNGDDIWGYDYLWVRETNKESDVNLDNTNRLLNSKQQIISLILDAQLLSGRRFDEFIDSLPVENEMLVEFIFGAEDEDLLLSELFELLGYLGYEMNIIDKDGE